MPVPWELIVLLAVAVCVVFALALVVMRQVMKRDDARAIECLRAESSTKSLPVTDPTSVPMVDATAASVALPRTVPPGGYDVEEMVEGDCFVLETETGSLLTVVLKDRAQALFEVTYAEHVRVPSDDHKTRKFQAVLLCSKTASNATHPRMLVPRCWTRWVRDNDRWFRPTRITRILRSLPKAA